MADIFARPIDKLGIVVPDLEAEIQSWLELRVGPFFTVGGAIVGNYSYRGERSSPTVNAAFSQVGPLQLELIQPIDDEPSAYRDFLAAGGSGLHHVGWATHDLNGARKAVEADGARQSVLQDGTLLGCDLVYYELSEPMASAPFDLQGTIGRGVDRATATAAAWDGKIAEIIEPDRHSDHALARIRDQVDGWDYETEPVRHLLGRGSEKAFELHTVTQRVGRWFREKT